VHFKLWVDICSAIQHYIVLLITIACFVVAAFCEKDSKNKWEKGAWYVSFVIGFFLLLKQISDADAVERKLTMLETRAKVVQGKISKNETEVEKMQKKIQRAAAKANYLYRLKCGDLGCL
jgi:hypothetical protein